MASTDQPDTARYASGLWSDGVRLLSTERTSGLVIVRQRFACLRQIISSPCLLARVIVKCDLQVTGENGDDQAIA